LISNFDRRTFVSRAGHCAFTPAETIAAVGTLMTRVETGSWPTVEANVLNAEATALGPLNILAVNGTVFPTLPAFVDFSSGPYPRPFDSLDAPCPKGGDDSHNCPLAFLLQH
jgi:hypothetical protein